MLMHKNKSTLVGEGRVVARHKCHKMVSKAQTVIIMLSLATSPGTAIR